MRICPNAASKCNSPHLPSRLQMCRFPSDPLRCGGVRSGNRGTSREGSLLIPAEGFIPNSTLPFVPAKYIVGTSVFGSDLLSFLDIWAKINIVY